MYKRVEFAVQPGVPNAAPALEWKHGLAAAARGRGSINEGPPALVGFRRSFVKKMMDRGCRGGIHLIDTYPITIQMSSVSSTMFDSVADS